MVLLSEVEAHHLPVCSGAGDTICHHSLHVPPEGGPEADLCRRQEGGGWNHYLLSLPRHQVMC